ncbi:MAG: hypothetical protein RLZZ31_22 [Actinomycetota bacterium]
MTDSPCIGCGLCCDGTVVTHLAVRDESDLGMPLLGLGVEVLFAADPPVFALPCPALGEGQCTIFSLHRPSACGQFECAVSAAFLEGKLSLAMAKEKIQQTFSLRDRMRAGEITEQEFDAHIDNVFRRRI